MPILPCSPFREYHTGVYNIKLDASQNDNEVGTVNIDGADGVVKFDAKSRSITFSADGTNNNVVTVQSDANGKATLIGSNNDIKVVDHGPDLDGDNDGHNFDVTIDGKTITVSVLDRGIFVHSDATPTVNDGVQPGDFELGISWLDDRNPDTNDNQIYGGRFLGKDDNEFHEMSVGPCSETKKDDGSGKLDQFKDWLKDKAKDLNPFD